MHEIISIDEHDLLNAVFNAEMRTKLMNIRSSYRFYLLNDRCLLVKNKGKYFTDKFINWSEK